MPTIVIGTAGHIDHGKTSLLRALTGIDADRLPEEQARGMTIDVGYAHLTFDDGIELDFVDVPGHNRLIGNMLVGAGEIDAAMLVVAADDGPRPQTLEHLQLLDALAIGEGLAVVTKVDAVDPARAAEVMAAVAALLAATSLAAAPVLAASSVTGEGIDAVRVVLRTIRDRLAARWPADGPAPKASGPLRLAVDRAFAVKGRGAVVTGSLRGGVLEPGSVLRREPGGEPIRVREVQVHGSPRDRHDGGRTALNVAGLPVEALRRGDVLTSGPAVLGSSRLLVDLRPAAPLGTTVARPPKRGALLRLHIGTDQVDALLQGIGARPGTALLTLEREAATFAGDRAIVREPASGQVVAGVRVLDPRPPRGASGRRMTVERLAFLAAAVDAGEAAAIAAARIDLHGAVAGEPAPGAPHPTSAGRNLSLAPDVRASLEAAALEAVAMHHREVPLSQGLALPRARAALLRRLRSLATIERRDADAAQSTVAGVLDDLVDQGRLGRLGEALRDPVRGPELPPDLVAAMGRLEAVLAVAAPPPLDAAAVEAGCPPEGVRALQAGGRIVRLGPELAWATPTFHRLAALALERSRVAPLTPAAYRDATGTSRRYVLAILEDLDRRGILQRTPEGHIPGPRAPGAATRAGGVTAPGPELPLPRPGVTAIVLAGGRSSRFGGPKLDTELDGTTLLDHAIRAVASVAGDVVVAGPAANTEPGREPAASIRFVDDDEAFAGPLAALAGALRETSTDVAIVVAGDMPGLVPAVLASMLQRLEFDPDVDAAHLASPTPTTHRQVLPLAIRVARAATAAAEALAARDRSLVRLLERLRTVEVPAAEWLALDPTARTLFDVDEPADLERWERREFR